MATKNWRGDAMEIAEVKTITVGGVWANGDTASMTANGKSVTVTFGNGIPTTDQVAAALKAAWEGDAVTAYGETRNITGNLVPEFNEITGTVASSVVTLTHDTKGVPFTITVSETSAAGTLSLATPTAATGPNNLNEAANWSPSGVPIAGDDVWFDDSDVDVLYNLDALAAVTLNSLRITKRFSGKIGLPRINTSNSAGDYIEYRPTYLEMAGVTTTMEVQSNSSRLKLDTKATAAVVNVDAAGSGNSSEIPAILWKGTHANNALNVRRGQVGVALFAGETATIGNLRVSFDTNIHGDAAVNLGTGVTWTTMDQTGGTITTQSGGTTISKTNGELTLATGNVTTLNLNGGNTYYSGDGTLGTVKINSGALLDLSRDMRACAITTLDIYAGGKFKDPFKRVTTLALDLEQAALDDVELDLGTNFKITRGAVT